MWCHNVPMTYRKCSRGYVNVHMQYRNSVSAYLNARWSYYDRTL